MNSKRHANLINLDKNHNFFNVLSIIIKLDRKDQLSHYAANGLFVYVLFDSISSSLIQSLPSLVKGVPHIMQIIKTDEFATEAIYNILMFTIDIFKLFTCILHGGFLQASIFWIV